MLLQILVHQPQMLVPIVQQTPPWVWGLLAALLWLGASQLFDRTAGLRRVLLMPVAMTGLSVYGLASAFTGSAPAGTAAGAWLATALATTALALWFQPTAPAGTVYTGASRSFHLPGSAMPLALIVGIFLTKYGVGISWPCSPRSPETAIFRCRSLCCMACSTACLPPARCACGGWHAGCGTAW
mgnify:CR=1 FL=1